MKILKDITANVEKGDSAAVKELTKTALSQKIAAEEILNDGLVKGMEVIGIKFKKNEIFIPEVLIATRAMKAGMDIIRPYFTEEKNESKGKIVMGTVKGDLHDIGKKIVCMILESEGFEVVDIGIDVPKEKFLTSIKKENPDIIGMSALLTTTMVYMREVIEAVEKAKLKQNIKIIIGGAPITQSFADELKVDGYAPDGVSAVELVKNLLKK
ncbi:MAG TPA: cobalamin-binding protein [Candidatus Aminicenantes bacterium]|nr:cobalamin-binding protein [Candidatus Aminicenantes bacterium]